jgi:ribosomal protein S10
MRSLLQGRLAPGTRTPQRLFSRSNGHRATSAVEEQTIVEASIPSLYEHRYIFRFMTWDIRSKRINENMKRMQLLIRAGGGVLHAGVGSPRDRRERLAVLRSPFVHKKSQEHFERVTRSRILRWHWIASPSPSLPPIDMGHAVAMETPAGYSVRVTETQNGLAALAHFFPDVIETAVEKSPTEQST